MIDERKRKRSTSETGSDYRMYRSVCVHTLLTQSCLENKAPRLASSRFASPVIGSIPQMPLINFQLPSVANLWMQTTDVATEPKAVAGYASPPSPPDRTPPFHGSIRAPTLCLDKISRQWMFQDGEFGFTYRIKASDLPRKRECALTVKPKGKLFICERNHGV